MFSTTCLPSSNLHWSPSGLAAGVALMVFACAKVTTDYDDSAGPSSVGSAGSSAAGESSSTAGADSGSENGSAASNGAGNSSSTGGADRESENGGASGSEAPSDGGTAGSDSAATGGSAPAGGGTGGSAAGTGGSAAGTGGSAAGTGGSAAGTGGTDAESTGGTDVSATGGADAAGAGGVSAGGSGMGGLAAAGASPVDCEGALFCDDFEDGDALGWERSGGTWTVVTDDSHVYEGGGNSEESLAGDEAWTDQIVQARVKVTNFGGNSASYRAGIIARYTGPSDFYALAVGADGNLTLLKSTSTVSGCSAVDSGIDASDWFTLRLEVSGPADAVQIRTFLNDAPMHECTVSNGLANGKVGFLTYGSETVAHFDDMVVVAP